jgi:hypothetical protein
MREQVESLLLRIIKDEPSPRLLGKVLARIEIEKQGVARTHFLYFMCASLLSFAALIPAFKNVTSALSQSGFPHYFGLILSDMDAVLLSWKEFSLLLVESLPLITILICLTAAFVFFWSFREAMRNMNRSFILATRAS